MIIVAILFIFHCIFGEVVQIDRSLWPVVNAAANKFWIVAFVSDNCLECNSFLKIFENLSKRTSNIANLGFGRVYCPLSFKVTKENLVYDSSRNITKSYGKEFYEKRVRESLLSARGMLPTVVRLVEPRSVCDVGCGTGVWLRTIQEIAGIDNSDAHGFDLGVPSRSLLINPSQYHDTDLTKRLNFEKKFDLCMTVEVGEHLSEGSADTFVESLVSLAPVILFGAAVPGQGGVHHVNEQWPIYWQEKFKKHHYYAVDSLRKMFWNNRDISVFYRQNTFLYIRQDKLSSFGFTPELGVLMSLVHPDIFAYKCKRRALPPLVNEDSGMCHMNKNKWAISIFYRGSNISYSGACDSHSIGEWIGRALANLGQHSKGN